MDVNKIWCLMQQSFSLNYLRTFEHQKKLFESNLCKCKTIEQDNDLLCFICYWDFDDFIFVEYLATDERFRGEGLGSKLLNDILNIGKKIILEVELVKDEDPYSLKRVEFYKRIGFNYNKYFYEQPPLTTKTGFVEMRIMSYPNPIKEDEFLKIKNILHTDCYKYKGL